MPIFSSFVRWAVARPLWASSCLALFCLPSLLLTLSFFSNIHAGLDELLPKSAPSVRALDKLNAHFKGQSHLIVVAQSERPEVNRQFVRDLGARLQAMRSPLIGSVQYEVARERRFTIDHAPMLLPRPRFDQLIGGIEKAIHQAAEQALSLDLDEDTRAPKESFEQLQGDFDRELAANDRFPHDVLETPDGKTAVVLVSPLGSELDFDPIVAFQAAVKREAGAIRSQYPDDLQVAYTGEVQNVIEEHDAILADLSISSLLVFVLVGALVIAYFRSLRSVLVIAMALVPGLLATFAFGDLAVGHLNSNTAFLGSIIAGNGVNYALLLLAYYRARPLGEETSAAIVAASAQAFPGTLAAAVTASAAYGGLAASSLRGFSQFGWIGGVGMLTVWLLTFVSMPIAISLLNPPRQAAQESFTQALLTRFFAKPRLPVAVSAAFLALVIAVGLSGCLRGFKTGFYETDMRVLRNRDSLLHGSASWDKRINELFGVWLNPVVGLVNNSEDRERLAGKFRQALANDPELAERVETIEAIVPNPEEQAYRLTQLRKLAPRVRGLAPSRLPEKWRPYLKAWMAPENLEPVALAEVPETMKRGYFERDGRADRTILVFPSLRINYDQADNVLAFADRLHGVALPDGAVVGGSFMFMAEIIRLVRDEALRVIVVVCLLVGAALLPIYWRKPWRIAIVVGTVLVVACASQAIMIALGVRINMLNFAAVPITIGVGADYVVNLLGAIDAFGISARRACAKMGPAIGLCSLTTIVGYFSLVMAQSGALRTFGWAAVLGELMAVTTVLLVVPSLAAGGFTATVSDNSPRG